MPELSKRLFCIVEASAKFIRNAQDKLADTLDVALEEIKESAEKFSIKNDNSTFNDNSGNYNQYYNIPNSVIENLQEYIALLQRNGFAVKLRNNPQGIEYKIFIESRLFLFALLSAILYFC